VIREEAPRVDTLIITEEPAVMAEEMLLRRPKVPRVAGETTNQVVQEPEADTIRTMVEQEDLPHPAVLRTTHLGVLVATTALMGKVQVEAVEAA